MANPAFQFYVSDFREDPNTIVMNTTEIGAYWLLIMECWKRDNALPADMEFLAHVARLTTKRFQSMWEAKIRRCFRFDGAKNIYFHKRLAMEIQKQKAWSSQKSKAGQIGAAKRWQNNDLHNTAMADLCDRIADDSSLKSKKKIKEEIKKEEKKKTEQPSDHSVLMRHHADRIGTITDGGAQGKAIKSLLAKFSVTDAIACYDYEVSEMQVHGGWRSKVNWLTVLGFISEWITAGRPKEWVKKNGTNRTNNTKSDPEKIAESADFYANYESQYPS